MNDQKTQKERTILFAGYAASHAAAELADSCREELKKHYSADFAESAAHLTKSNEEILSAASAYKRGETEAFTTENGLLAALWEMGEFYKSGFSIDMNEIPLRQETVEVCELLGLDPFSLPSAGCIFFVTDHPQGLKETLDAKGISAAVIGILKDGKGRTLHYGERVRYLDKPVR